MRAKAYKLWQYVLYSDYNALLSCRFAHAETLIPLACALGLYKDREPLSPNKYKGLFLMYC